MGTLGDLFPESLKQQQIERHLKPGQVLYLFCTFPGVERDKYLVLASPGQESLLFTINSRMCSLIANSPHLKSCQVSIRVADHDFLDHDSFIDCSKVLQVDESEIRRQLLGDMSRIRGELTANTKQEIIKIVPGAKAISNRDKRRILDSLK